MVGLVDEVVFDLQRRSNEFKQRYNHQFDMQFY